MRSAPTPPQIPALSTLPSPCQRRTNVHKATVVFEALAGAASGLLLLILLGDLRRLAPHLTSTRKRTVNLACEWCIGIIEMVVSGPGWLERLCTHTGPLLFLLCATQTCKPNAPMAAACCCWWLLSGLRKRQKRARAANKEPRMKWI